MIINTIALLFFSIAGLSLKRDHFSKELEGRLVVKERGNNETLIKLRLCSAACSDSRSVKGLFWLGCESLVWKIGRAHV